MHFKEHSLSRNTFLLEHLLPNNIPQNSLLHTMAKKYQMARVEKFLSIREMAVYIVNSKALTISQELGVELRYVLGGACDFKNLKCNKHHSPFHITSFAQVFFFKWLLIHPSGDWLYILKK